MPTATTEKPATIEVPEIKTGVRAVIWDPSKDPTCFSLPPGGTPMRAFVFVYLDEKAIGVTPLSPSGDVIPQFPRFILQPGLNWVESSDLDAAQQAAEISGSDVADTYGVASAVDRLKMSTRQGYNPIAVQIKAGAIKILEPLPKATMTGTLSDYDVSEIAEICAVVNDAIEVESWLSSIASNAVNPHPKKVHVEKLLKKTLEGINSGNR